MTDGRFERSGHAADREAHQVLRRSHGGPRGEPGRPVRGGGRPAGSERRREDHHLLHGRRPDGPGLRARAAQRARRHRRPDVPARAQGHRLPAPGTVHLPRTHRRAEHPGHPGDARPQPRRAPGAGGRAAGRAEPHRAGEGQRQHAVGRRAPPRRDYARARHLAVVHASRRALRRHRPHRHRRHPGHHLPPQGARHRRADHGPQRPRDAAHHGPRVHRPRRRGVPQRHAGRPGRRRGREADLSGRGISVWTKIDRLPDRRTADAYGPWRFSRSCRRGSPRNSS